MLKNIIIALATLACFLCNSSVSVAKKAKVRINDAYVIHFIIDGTNLQTFNNVMASGKLPTLHKYFVENGARFELALSSFPTTSTSVYQSYATGLFPGHAGIPHLERFDRQKQKAIGYLTPRGAQMVNSDLINLRALTNPEVVDLDATTTIFELLQGYPTASIYSSFQRGATIRHPKKAPLHAIWSTFVSNNVEMVDVLAYREVKRLFDGPIDEIPRYSLVGLYSSDIMGHRYGPGSKQVADALVQFDLFMKEFTELLSKRKLTDKTHIIISADHGMHTTGEVFDIAGELKDMGVYMKPANPKDKKYTVYASNRGVVSSQIYVKHDGGFAPLNNPELLRKHPTIDGGEIDLIDAIAGLDATNLIIVRSGPRSARVYDSNRRSARIDCFTINLDDYCSYRFDRSKGDPLGYSKSRKVRPLLDGRPHSSRAWRQASADEKYPDAVIQFSQIFRDGRAGDMFVTARKGFGFRKGKAGNHGGALADDMHVPFLIAGPKIEPGSYGVIRTVDLYPLMLNWFGIEIPNANHDGIDPFEKHVPDDLGWRGLAAIEQLISENRNNKRLSRGRAMHAAKFRNRARLARLASEEATRRQILVTRMNELLLKLKAQKKSSKAPQVADKNYVDDHIAIVEQNLSWARKNLRDMNEAVVVLGKNN
jgi:predicted AlkP superfamily pyrophosphatase or phosphodiesterase